MVVDALGVTVELVEQLKPGQPGRQRLRVQVGRDENEGVVMRRRPWRRAWADIDGLLGRADAANELVRGLAGLALGKRGDGRRDIP